MALKNSIYGQLLFRLTEYQILILAGLYICFSRGLFHRHSNLWH